MIVTHNVLVCLHFERWQQCVGSCLTKFEYRGLCFVVTVGKFERKEMMFRFNEQCSDTAWPADKCNTDRCSDARGRFVTVLHISDRSVRNCKRRCFIREIKGRVSNDQLSSLRLGYCFYCAAHVLSVVRANCEQ